MSASRVIRCLCNHDFQDSRYGKTMRVHNETKDGNWTCTVCSNEKSGR